LPFLDPKIGLDPGTNKSIEACYEASLQQHLSNTEHGCEPTASGSAFITRGTVQKRREKEDKE